ncbi:hypothetical protein Hanom_Chr17g01588631 [Helianthus anomalus]
MGLSQVAREDEKRRTTSDSTESTIDRAVDNRRSTGCNLSCYTMSNRAGDKKYTRTRAWHQSACADHCSMIST